jgi:hypothetical protein
MHRDTEPPLKIKAKWGESSDSQYTSRSTTTSDLSVSQVLPNTYDAASVLKTSSDHKDLHLDEKPAYPSANQSGQSVGLHSSFGNFSGETKEISALKPAGSPSSDDLRILDDEMNTTLSDEEPLMRDMNPPKRPVKGKKRSQDFMPATTVKLDHYHAVNHKFIEDNMQNIYRGETTAKTMQMLLKSQIVTKEYNRIFPKQFVRRRLGAAMPPSNHAFAPAELTTIFEKVAYP